MIIDKKQLRDDIKKRKELPDFGISPHENIKRLRIITETRRSFTPEVVEALLDELESLVTPYTWIPVNERMPEPGKWLALYGQRVFTHGSDKGKPFEKPCVDQGYLGSDGKFYFLNWDDPGDINDNYNNDLAIATHWVYWELPEAPYQEHQL